MTRCSVASTTDTSTHVNTQGSSASWLQFFPALYMGKSKQSGEILSPNISFIIICNCSAKRRSSLGYCLWVFKGSFLKISKPLRMVTSWTRSGWSMQWRWHLGLWWWQFSGHLFGLLSNPPLFSMELDPPCWVTRKAVVFIMWSLRVIFLVSELSQWSPRGLGLTRKAHTLSPQRSVWQTW